jgi:signal peptidase I
MEWLSHLTEGLANLSVKTVLIAVGVMMLALTTFRLSARSRDNATDWLVENIQVVLSVVVVVFLIIRPFLFQAFYIPSSSMEPTLMGPQTAPGQAVAGETTGDRLLVNKLIYRVSDPNRFDIAVFKAPKSASPDEKEFIKRVIGLPGDTVEVVPPRLLVGDQVVARLGDAASGGLNLGENTDPKMNAAGTEAQVPLGYGDTDLRIIAARNPVVRYDPYKVEVNGKVELDDPNGRIEVVTGTAMYGGDDTVEASIYRIDGEPRLIVANGTKLTFDPGHVLVNGKRLIEPYVADYPRYTMSAKKLKPGEYFMMGDNRNNSNDSHMWGTLDRSRIIGRAEILFWPINRFNIVHWWLIMALGGIFVGYQLVQRLIGPR